MKVIIKRFAIGAALLGLLLLLLWPQVLATTMFYYTKFSVDKEQHAAQITTLTPTASSTMTEYEQAEFDSFTFPVPFLVATTTVGDTYYRTFKQDGTALVLLDDLESRDTFLSNPERSEEDKALMCEFLSVSRSSDVCASNYDFYLAIIESDINSVGFFASRAEKLSQSILVILRSVILLNSAEVQVFETETIHGFIFAGTERSTLVTFFDENDQQYLLISTMKPEELSHVLARLSKTQ